MVSNFVFILIIPSLDFQSKFSCWTLDSIFSYLLDNMFGCSVGISVEHVQNLTYHLPFRSSPDHEFSTLVVGIGTNPVSHVISKQDLPNWGPSGEDYSLHSQGSILWPFPLARDVWIWVDASPNLDQSGYLPGLSSAIIDAWTRAVAAVCMEKSRKLVNRERLKLKYKEEQRE